MDSLPPSSSTESQRLNTREHGGENIEETEKIGEYVSLALLYVFLFFNFVSFGFSVVKLFFLRSAGSLAPRMLD